uniref:Uncharacterized protein n=1 Tax=Parastrongyloides trichosuri TaxID=131310 RepID=A0A0N4ZA75_PARTI
MSVDLKQEFELFDLMGPVVCAAIFALFLFLFSFFILNYCCILKNDDITKFEEWGYRHNLGSKLGPHTKVYIDNCVKNKRAGLINSE